MASILSDKILADKILADKNLAEGGLADAAVPAVRPGLLARLRSFDLVQQSAFEYLLLLRFALFNACAVAVLAVAWGAGLISPILAGDTTFLSHLIVAVFLLGFVLCARRVWQISIELNAARSASPKPGTRAAGFLALVARSDPQGRSSLAAALKLKLATRIAVVRHVANSLVLLGLIGTVVGFIIALSGVDPALVADIASVGPTVSTLIEGMGIALYTTLVGAVLNIWLMVDYRLLESGTVNLLARLIERVEVDHGRA